MSFLASLLDLVFPPRCVHCGAVGKYFCDQCLPKVRCVELPICPYCKKNSIGGLTHPYCQKKFGLDGLSSSFYFEGPIKKAVHTLKYKWVTNLQAELLTLAESSFKKQEVAFKNYLLVPTPLFPSKERERGFNQAKIITDFLSPRWQLPVSLSLKRIKNTKTQAKLDLKGRLENLKEAFWVEGEEFKGKEVLVVDDVFTTGATLFSLAEVLKKAGAKKVWGLTLARSQAV